MTLSPKPPSPEHSVGPQPSYLELEQFSLGELDVGRSEEVRRFIDSERGHIVWQEFVAIGDAFEQTKKTLRVAPRRPRFFQMHIALWSVVAATALALMWTTTTPPSPKFRSKGSAHPSVRNLQSGAPLSGDRMAGGERFEIVAPKRGLRSAYVYENGVWGMVCEASKQKCGEFEVEAQTSGELWVLTFTSEADYKMHRALLEKHAMPKLRDAGVKVERYGLGP